MTIEVLKSKIHRVTVTGAELDYVGSITIDPVLMNAADLVAGEKVQVVNINNGERFTTYAISAERGSGVISVNGAAAHRANKGDLLIIGSYVQLDEEEAKSHQPRLCYFENAKNDSGEGISDAELRARNKMTDFKRAIPTQSAAM